MGLVPKGSSSMHGTGPQGELEHAWDWSPGGAYVGLVPRGSMHGTGPQGEHAWDWSPGGARACMGLVPRGSIRGTGPQGEHAWNWSPGGACMGLVSRGSMHGNVHVLRLCNPLFAVSTGVSWMFNRSTLS